MDIFGMKKRKAERDFNQEVNLAIAQELNYFAEATAEHFIAYGELANIAKSKINPDFSETNYQQQSGFSAEVKNVARTNAENIINFDSTRISRTDNVGLVNHPQFDYILVDKNNNPLLDAEGHYIGGTQQKNFSKVDNYNKLINKDYEHYKSANIAVPPNQYDEIISNWDNIIEGYKKQSEYFRSNGNVKQAEIFDKKIKEIQDVKSRTIKSKVTTDDAMEARKSPLTSTVKDISRVAHKAGIQSMKNATVIGGSISVIKNFSGVVNGDKEIDEALEDVAVDTGKSAVVSYAIGAGSSMVGGALKSSSVQLCKNLSKKSGPAAIINTGLILANNTKTLLCGKISGADYVSNIGQEGTTLAASMTGANLGATVGTCILPGIGSIVGGVVGGMIASMLSGSMFRELQKSISDTKISNEQRKIIEAACKQLKLQEKRYQDMFNLCLDYFLDCKENQIRNSFSLISNAIENGTSIEPGLKLLGNAFGQDMAFDTNEDLQQHIDHGNTLHL